MAARESGTSPLPEDSEVPLDPDEGIDYDKLPLPKTKLGRLQRRAWVLLDDPSSSKLAKNLSTGMMFVILLSICSFTIASNPSYTWYTDVWADNATLAKTTNKNGCWNFFQRCSQIYRRKGAEARWCYRR